MTREHAPSAGVSIVTVALNAAAALPLTLESIIGQDVGDRQILLVDGASWDRTGEVLRRYAPVVDRVVVAEDAGIYDAMNKALSSVEKEYVLFMNAGDQFYCANAISRMITALEDSPDIFYGNHVYIDRGLELFKRAAPFEQLAARLANGRIDGAWLDCIPCHQATFVRTALLRQLRFDTRLRVSADHDLLFRAHAGGARMQYVDEIVSHYFSGGFSAAAGERTRLEGASVYRRFSDRPDLVDRAFFPSASPLAPQTRRTGVKLSGFLPVEGWAAWADPSRGGDWVAAEGAELLAPEQESHGIELAGYCELGEQQVSFWLGDAKIGECAVPRGFFRLELGFHPTVPPGTVVRALPRHTHLLGDRHRVPVGFALSSFRFAHARTPIAAGIAPGEQVRFQSDARADLLPLLGEGWSEPEVTHTWSLGDHADLWLKLAPTASRGRLSVSGNPYVPDGRQRLELHVNAQPLAAVTLDHGGPATLEWDCGHEAWRPNGINHLVLRPSSFTAPPAETKDTRPLGFCLWSLDVM